MSVGQRPPAGEGKAEGLTARAGLPEAWPGKPRGLNPQPRFRRLCL